MNEVKENLAQILEMVKVIKELDIKLEIYRMFGKLISKKEYRLLKKIKKNYIKDTIELFLNFMS